MSPPPPDALITNATIIFKNGIQKMIFKFEKSFRLVCKTCQEESIDKRINDDDEVLKCIFGQNS